MAFCKMPDIDRIQSRPYASTSTSPSNHVHSLAFPESYQYCGYLEHQNIANNSWNKKYVVISNNFLLVAATPISPKLEQVIYLEGCSIKHTEANKVFTLFTTNDNMLHFRSSSAKQSILCINAVEKASKFKIKDMFRFLYTLGTSGMTKVVAAKHRNTNEESAIKIVDKRYCNKQMLKTEIKILKKLENEYIVNLYDVIETRKYLYIIMQMCVGGELFDKIVELDGDHYTERDSCLIMHQIAKGVKYMHSVGIIHRDLKPENILCVEPQSIQKIKIADFGISKLFNQIQENNEQKDNENMAMDVLLCTISYTAPEILARKQYDYRADYFSIGVILYILLCGYAPFGADDDEDDQHLIKSILKDAVEFDDDDWWHVSNETKDLVKGLLQKDPAKRKTCDDILKLVWKVTNSTISFAKAHENFKQHVLKTKMKNYSFSAYNNYNMTAEELFEIKAKRDSKKRGSASLNAIPGIINLTQSPDIKVSTTSDVGISSNFVFLEDY